MIERKDKLKNKAKIVKEVVKDPFLTQKEIENKTGLGHGTVNRHIQELDKTGLSTNLMDRILENDDKIMDLVNEVTYLSILEKVKSGEKLTLQDQKLLGDLANNSTKRKAIFGDTGNKDKTYNFIIS